MSVLAPKIQIKIEGNLLAPKILDFVSSCKVEMAHDKADLITIGILNPLLMQPGKQRTSDLPFTDHVAFAPGNIVEVFISYSDAEPEFIQAGIIQKMQPSFPSDGMPTITLKCFDGSVLLMNGTNEISSTASRQFGGDRDERLTLAEIARKILSEYGFDVSQVDTVTPTPKPAIATHKGEGKTDYQLIQGMANTLGWEFFVEWDTSQRKWAAVFRPPKTDTSAIKRFTWGPDFELNGSVGGILHDFNPQFSIMNAPSDIEVFYFDEGSRTWEKIIYPPPKPPKKKPKARKFSWQGDDTTFSEDLQAAGTDTGARGLRIQAGGVSVEVVPKQGFRTSKEAFEFARAWFKARMDLLIQGSGVVTGYTKLKPRQVQKLHGIGSGLSGDWFFTEVSHNFQAANGTAKYECEFVANKVIP